MKCWRDLSQECAGSNCPMWMDGFDVPDLDEGSGIGLNESKCAMVLKEKIALYEGLMDIVEIIRDMEDRNDEDFFRMLDEGFDETPREKSTKREDPSQNRLIPIDESKQAQTPTDTAPRKKRGKTGNAAGPV